jgi:cation transport ATPase
LCGEVLVIALATLVTWWLYNGDVQGAIINAVAVLVICPCALGFMHANGDHDTGGSRTNI